MNIVRIGTDRASRDEYVVLSSFGPKIHVTRFGPASLLECQRFIECETITAIERNPRVAATGLEG